MGREEQTGILLGSPACSGIPSPVELNTESTRPPPPPPHPTPFKIHPHACITFACVCQDGWKCCGGFWCLNDDVGDFKGDFHTVHGKQFELNEQTV